MMREILLKHNRHFKLVEVPNGKEAMDYLDRAKQSGKLPCLIILEINMPVLDWKRTLSLIKSDAGLSHIPVVMFTTSNSELDRIYCQKLGTRMITKPPDFKTLQATIMQILELRLS
jgi:CheY-like chemotaxis protein